MAQAATHDFEMTPCSRILTAENLRCDETITSRGRLGMKTYPKGAWACIAWQWAWCANGSCLHTFFPRCASLTSGNVPDDTLRDANELLAGFAAAVGFNALALAFGRLVSGSGCLPGGGGFAASLGLGLEAGSVSEGGGAGLSSRRTFRASNCTHSSHFASQPVKRTLTALTTPSSLFANRTSVILPSHQTCARSHTAHERAIPWVHAH